MQVEYYNNIMKRAVKTPKVYFLDTGLAAYLTKWKDKDVLEAGTMAGNFFENSKYKQVFDIWKNAKKVKVSKEQPQDVYYVHHGAKIRYINPLVNGERISNICKIAKKMIDNNLAYDMENYVYLDFSI